MLFKTFVDEAVVSQPLLPFFHTTKCTNLTKILATRQILTTDCDVFSRKLAYSFYGFPAYKTKEFPKDEFNRHMLPVCFMFEPKMSDIAQIFPFDSGGFEKLFMKKGFSDVGTLEDFKMSPSIDSCQRLVSAFFGSPTDYINGAANSNNAIDPLNFPARAYKEAINRSNTDARWYSCEVSFDKPIHIDGNLKYIYVPNEVIRAEALIEFCEKNPSIMIMPYFSPSSLSYESVYGSIAQVVWSCLNKEYGIGL